MLRKKQNRLFFLIFFLFFHFLIVFGFTKTSVALSNEKMTRTFPSRILLVPRLSVNRGIPIGATGCGCCLFGPLV